MYCVCGGERRSACWGETGHKSCRPPLGFSLPPTVAVPVLSGRRKPRLSSADQTGLKFDRPVEKHGVTSRRNTGPLINLRGQQLLYLEPGKGLRWVFTGVEWRGLPVPCPQCPLDTAGEPEAGLRTAKPSLNHLGTQLEGPVPLLCRVLVSSCFLCSWSFPSPSTGGTARLPSEHSTLNLKCFVKLCQALRWSPGHENVPFPHFQNNPFHFQ